MLASISNGLFLTGADAAGSNVDFTYKRAGSYTTTLRITDSLGETATKQMDINIAQLENFVPIIQPLEPFVIYDDEDLSLNASVFDFNSF